MLSILQRWKVAETREAAKGEMVLLNFQAEVSQVMGL